ncbi:MAG: DUF4437 domain-containing protein [Planctomycetota bacterium]
MITATEVLWTPLNPARGNAGPQAADLWGDRTVDGATGFLVRFAEGFSSPPHVHNTTYRGVVLEGLVHNDDPNAEPSWMSPGSYWTQPAGDVHITSAKGDGRIAYIEIQHGPYLVMPPEEASDSGERSINVHAANVVWLDASTTNRVSLGDQISPERGPRISFLWGDPQDQRPSGAMVALPANQLVTIRSHDPALRIVVVKGQPRLRHGSELQPVELPPGSAVLSNGSQKTVIHLTGTTETWLYVRCAGAFEVYAASRRLSRPAL